MPCPPLEIARRSAAANRNRRRRVPAWGSAVRRPPSSTPGKTIEFLVGGDFRRRLTTSPYARVVRPAPQPLHRAIPANRPSSNQPTGAGSGRAATFFLMPSPPKGRRRSLRGLGDEGNEGGKENRGVGRIGRGGDGGMVMWVEWDGGKVVGRREGRKEVGVRR